MSKRKDNGRRPKKGVSPAHLVPHQIKPGQVLNPQGISGHTITAELRAYLEEKVRRTLEDGTEINWPRRKVLTHILGALAMKGPDRRTTHDANWQFAMRQVLDRVDPVPRETTLLAVNVQTEHTHVAVNFIDGIREKTGRQDITHDDVLRALEAQTFGGNGRDGGDAGS